MCSLRQVGRSRQHLPGRLVAASLQCLQALRLKLRAAPAYGLSADEPVFDGLRRRFVTAASGFAENLDEVVGAA